MSGEPDGGAGLELLLADLEQASEAARAIATVVPIGVRAVEDRPRRRAYLCAFEGPRFLCLRSSLSPEEERDAALEVASAVLLVEHTEGVLGGDALGALAESAGRVIVALGGHAGVESSVAEVAERALELERWAAAPERAIASVPALDEAVRRHDALVVAWTRFVRASQPLAEAPERLPGPLLDALRALEEAAGAAWAGGSITDTIADALPTCRAGAREMLEAHVTPLR